ncbi:unnamed protein product, partial [Ectocarpus sp. 13 AM-2016]
AIDSQTHVALLVPPQRNLVSPPTSQTKTGVRTVPTYQHAHARSFVCSHKYGAKYVSANVLEQELFDARTASVHWTPINQGPTLRRQLVPKKPRQAVHIRRTKTHFVDPSSPLLPLTVVSSSKCRRVAVC